METGISPALVELTPYGEKADNLTICRVTEINALKKSIENHEIVSKVNMKEYEDSKRLP